MSDQRSAVGPSLSADGGARRAPIVADFERVWRRGEEPRIADFLSAGPLDLALVRELIHADLEFRLKAGQRARIESYLENWPSLTADSQAMLGLIAAEARLRARVESALDLEEYRRRFPQYADALRDSMFGLSVGQANRPRAANIDDQETADLDSPTDGTQSYGQAPAPSGPVALPTIPGYRVIHRVARGGMGEVLEAEHLLLGRTVAIKMPLAHLIGSQDDRERFLREARSAAQLKHPHICAIHEVGEVRGCPYIVLDFVRGQTLKEWYRTTAPTARAAAALVAVLARAVEYAHKKGFIHRDLKPSNVLVDESGTPVLTDFGLAKQMGDETSQLTHSGQVLGTPAYMAPEQAAGQAHLVGPLSDVYALGAVFYELLCGRPPFAGNAADVLRKVQTERPPAPRTVNPRIHRDLETICLKAMSPEPASRYASALMLAEDLERFNSGEPILARRTGPIRRLLHRVRRRPATFAAALGVSALVALTAWLGGSVRTNLRVAQIAQEFEAGIDDADWNHEHLGRMETLVARLQPIAPERAQAAGERLYQRYADVHQALLKKPVLESADAARIDAALTVLDRRTPAASRLRAALEQRKRAWETVFELSPDAPIKDIFAAGAVEMRDERLFRAEGPTAVGPWLATSVASAGNVEMEIAFDEAWQRSRMVGMALNALEGIDSGYSFRLRVEDDSESAAGDFAWARRMRGSVSLEILRDATLLARTSVRAPQLKPGGLEMRVSRRAEQLRMQVNDLPPLEFNDVFPINRAQPGAFALLWPAKTGLTRLRGRRQKLPPVSSALELGDDCYARGEFEQAIKAYRSEAIASLGSLAEQEARYKEALCLAALQRAEARESLQVVATEPGDRWPVLAACQLWLDHLRAKQFDDADRVLESLSARYRVEQLAALVPAEQRLEINSYYGKQATAFGFYSYDPKRVEHLRRAVDVETLLASDNPLAIGARWQLLRALHAENRLDEALALAESLIGEGAPWHDTPHGSWAQEYVWLLCLAGQAEKALAAINDWQFDASGQNRAGYEYWLLSRAYALAALARWDEAELALSDWLRLLPPENQRNTLAVACLLHGFLVERRGDEAAAIAAWRRGLHLDDNPSTLTGNMLLGNLILGSLTDAMSDEQASRLSRHLCDSFTAGSVFSSMGGLMKIPPAVIRQAWRTPRGRETARKLAFRQAPMADFVRLPALVLIAETVRQGAFRSDWTDEQEAEVWRTLDETSQNFFRGAFDVSQAVSIAMTWKGTTNFLGWGGLANRLPPEQRGRWAYLLAHRLRTLGKNDEARSLLKTAAADSRPGSVLHRLASQELDAAGVQP